MTNMINSGEYQKRREERLKTSKPVNNKQRNRGAVTFLDVLGWKGIWRDEKNDDTGENAKDRLSRFIKEIEKQAKEIVLKYSFNKLEDKTLEVDQQYSLNKLERGKNFEVELLRISDTIVFFTSGSAQDAISIHCELCAWTLNNALKKGFPLRGAIGYGVYDHDESIMIGPAVDEAASWHESTDWIGVVLSPSVYFELERKLPKCAVEYSKIPYKKGVKGTNWCVDWNYGNAENNYKEICAAFSNRGPHMQEVAPKYLNTLDFLTREMNN